MTTEYDQLCPKGRLIRSEIMHDSGDIAVLARKCGGATRAGRTEKAERILERLEAMKSVRDGHRIDLSRHITHCTDGCTPPRVIAVLKSVVPVSDLPDAGEMRRGPAHRIALENPLPTAYEMASMIRGGHTVQGLSAVYNRPADQIAHYLNKAGYTRHGVAVVGPSGRQQARRARAFKTFARHLKKVGDWVEDALCAQTDPELFHPKEGGSQDAEQAKAICLGCPVRAQCLEAALDNNERDGIWGGATDKERRAMRRDRKKADLEPGSTTATLEGIAS